MVESNAAMDAFWRSFQEREAVLADAVSADHPDYIALLGELQDIHPGLFLEFCLDPGECELVVTADGNRDLFSLVRAIVARAPAVSGWTIRALKPKLGFPNTVTWDDLTIATDGIVFDALEREGSEELGLRIFVPGLKEVDVDKAHNAVLCALDHGLGEEKLAESIHHALRKGSLLLQFGRCRFQRRNASGDNLEQCCSSV